MRLQRLNMDSSWWLEWEEQKMMIDPWLTGPEIDGFRWLNIQWHSTKPLAFDELPPYDHILITQSYSDHCHPATLEKLDAQKPIYATPKAYHRLKKAFPERKIHSIPLWNEKTALTLNALTLSCLQPLRKRDPVYYALLLMNENKEAILYTPHGFELQKEELAFLQTLKIKLLVTTFSEFTLPALMGGKVNPGMEQVYRLTEQLQPEYVLNTHDEQKKMKGLVSKLAKINYPDYELLSETKKLNFIHLPDYRLWQTEENESFSH